MGASRPQTPWCFLVLDYLFSSTRKLQFYVELAGKILYRFGSKTVSPISPLQSPCPSRSWCRRVIGRVERGSFTLTLSQNRAWKYPLTRLFTLNSLCIDITLESDLSANDRKDCGLCPQSLVANWKPWQWACDGNACISCVPNRQAPCSSGS